MKTHLIPLLLPLLASVTMAQNPGPGVRPDRYGGNPPRVGEMVSDTSVLTPGGEPTTLAASWRDKPAVIVTASITCGPSCKVMPDLQPLREKFGDRINLVVLYVQEAHPDGEASPYYPNQPPRPPKAEGGHRQPRTVEERLDYAREFIRLHQPAATVVVDGMDNAAWQAVGKGPNLGLLVGADGTLIFKQGWFSLPKLTAAIERHLAAGP
jgi:hypothetical protein